MSQAAHGQALVQRDMAAGTAAIRQILSNIDIINAEHERADVTEEMRSAELTRQWGEAQA